MITYDYDFAWEYEVDLWYRRKKKKYRWLGILIVESYCYAKAIFDKYKLFEFQHDTRIIIYQWIILSSMIPIWGLIYYVYLYDPVELIDPYYS
jgi:hypothetical protein